MKLRRNSWLTHLRLPLVLSRGWIYNRELFFLINNYLSRCTLLPVWTILTLRSEIEMSSLMYKNIVQCVCNISYENIGTVNTYFEHIVKVS